jgi:hypothetical protein
MPLAITVSLMLLLGSMILQASTLQGRIQEAGRWHGRRQEDALLDLATALAADLNRRHSCLLDQARASWPEAGAACATAAERDALAQLGDGGHSGRLLDWRPDPDLSGGDLTIELAGGDDGAWRGRLRVDLADDAPLRISGLRLEALQEVAS